MSAIVDHHATAQRPRPQGCSRCGLPRSTQIVVRAQLACSRQRPLATAARGLCDECALDVFAALEDELDRQIAGAPTRTASNHVAGEAHDG